MVHCTLIAQLARAGQAGRRPYGSAPAVSEQVVMGAPRCLETGGCRRRTGDTRRPVFTRGATSSRRIKTGAATKAPPASCQPTCGDGWREVSVGSIDLGVVVSSAIGADRHKSSQPNQILQRSFRGSGTPRGHAVRPAAGRSRVSAPRLRRPRRDRRGRGVCRQSR